MTQEIFKNRAKNIVAIVGQLGAGTVDQVAAILQDVHQCAIEMVAEDFAKRATKVMQGERPNPEEYRFYQAQVPRIRQLKNGNPNL